MTLPRRLRFEANPEQSAVTPLELFFDLVFVFALTRVTDWMAEDPTPLAVLRGVLILIVMWWCWVGYSWLGNVVKADEGVIRLGMFVAMAAVFVAAIAIPEAFDDLPGGLDGPVVFAVCYFVVRAVHLVLFLVISREDAALRGQVLRFAASMAVGTVLLLVASQTSGLVQILLWVAAVIGDYLGTAVGGSKWRLASAGHFAERHGLIVIVALGESIVSIGIGVAELPVSWPVVAGSVLGLTVTGALWWVYFDVGSLISERALGAADGERQIRLARGGYTFLHLPMVVGIIMLALGLKKVLLYVGGGEGHTLTDPIYGVPLGTLAGGTALYLLALVAFTRYLTNGGAAVPRIVVAVLVLALVPLFAMAPALVTLLAVGVLLVILVAVETRLLAGQRHAVRHSGHHGG